MYINNMIKIKQSLITLANASQIKGVMSNISGIGKKDINIEADKIDYLLNTNQIDLPIYSSHLMGTKKAKRKSSGKRHFNYTHRCEYFFIFSNPLKENVTFLNDYSWIFLDHNKADCIITSAYAKRHNLTVGNNICIPLYRKEFINKEFTKFMCLDVQNFQIIALINEDDSFYKSDIITSAG
ncbi:MAG: hypothetical protein ACK5KR_03130 [Breznakia sp.]